MRAARLFAAGLNGVAAGRIQIELYGSLGLTGRGHGTDRAVVRASTAWCAASARASASRSWAAQLHRSMNSATLLFRGDIVLPHHPNGMRFTAFDSEGAILRQEIYCSGGGGFIEREGQPPAAGSDAVRRPYPFSSAAEMLAQGDAASLPIWAMMLENEKVLRGEAEIRERVPRIWTVMQKSRSAGSPQTDYCRAVWTCGGAPLNCTANSWRRRTTIRCAPSTGSTCMPSR